MTKTLERRKIRLLQPHRFYKTGAVLTPISNGFASRMVQLGKAEWVEDDKPKRGRPKHAENANS